jgi:hypothetical protein
MDHWMTQNEMLRRLVSGVISNDKVNPPGAHKLFLPRVFKYGQQQLGLVRP